MADVVDQTTRSRMMSGIRAKHTKPELLVRGVLTQAGVRYRLHRTELPGAPDIVIPSLQVAIFVHGCFWHAHTGCRFAKWPSTRPDFWRSKLLRNVDRDEGASMMLNMLGWRVLVVWECATRRAAATEDLAEGLLAWIAGNEGYGEIGEQTALI